MMTTLLLSAIIMLFAVPATAHDRDGFTPGNTQSKGARMRILARLYGRADSTDDGALTAAVPVAVSILSEAGIDVDLQSCQDWHAANGNDPCAGTLGQSGFAIRTYRSSALPLPRGEHRLGYSFLDFSTGQGALVTLDLSGIDWLATESGTNSRLLLGRALAHELGHLLLRTQQHSRSGLMRATWSAKELQRNRLKDWEFTDGEIAALHAGRVAAAHEPIEPAPLVAINHAAKR